MWVELLDKGEVRRWSSTLQQFACTEPRPRSEGGRKLPHPRPWEWEAQRAVRNAAQTFRRGDLLLLRRIEDDLAGVMHVRIYVSRDDGPPVAEVVVAAVARAYRGNKPPHVADELFERALQWLDARAGFEHVRLVGDIHIENLPSMKWATRHGFEPLVGVDEADGGYVPWGRRR